MNEQNVLQKSICYLIGAMDSEQLKDAGKGWRREVISKAKDNKLEIIFLDPTQKLENLVGEVDDDHKRLIKLQQENRFDELSLEMKKIVKSDMRLCDLSDMAIFYIDIDYFTCGSFWEIQEILRQKKPYFIICKQGKNKIPRWMYGVCKHSYFYNSIDEVINILTGINNGTIPIGDRWVLIRKELHKLSLENI